MAVASKSYILTPDGKAVVDDGKTTGVILVGAGGTIDDAVAKQYGIAIDKNADAPPVVSATSGQNADQIAVDAAKQSAAQMNPPVTSV